MQKLWTPKGEDTFLEDAGAVATLVAPRTDLDERFSEMEKFDAYSKKARAAGLKKLADSTLNKADLVRVDVAVGERRRLLVSLFQREEIPIYNLERVVSFMEGQAKEAKEKDRNPYSEIRFSWVPVGDYAKPMPEPILDTLTKVRELVEAEPGLDLGQALDFEVADLVRVQLPDPFLAIRFGFHEKAKIVFAHWDEPEFSFIDR